MQKRYPIALVILDGFGYSSNRKGNALVPSNIPYIEDLFNNHPSKYLCASGLAVGLPDNTAGNSEAGHLAIGTGQHIPQALTIINKMIDDGAVQNNQILSEALLEVKKKGTTVHIMGLASNGNVHGSIRHMLAYIKATQNAQINRIIVHAFLDGRDTLQQQAPEFLKEIDALTNNQTIIGSIHGRFYAMDRDKNQERTAKTYAILTQPTEPQFSSWQKAINYYYSQNLTDEYIPPTSLAHNSTIRQGDLIIHTNIRPERSIQLLEQLLSIKEISIISAIEYEKPIITIPLVKNPIITKCLKMTLHNQYKLQISTIAETEKWAHVTYFFDGYCKNRNLAYETRIHIPSIKTASFADIPTMSATKITQAVVNQIESQKADFCVVNYANLDMVGHTGNLDAAQQAAKIIDQEIAALYRSIVQKMNGTLIITGDHGNAEAMRDQTGQFPSGMHTTNPVPFIVVSNKGNPPVDTVKSLINIADYIELTIKNQAL